MRQSYFPVAALLGAIHLAHLLRGLLLGGGATCVNLQPCRVLPAPRAASLIQTRRSPGWLQACPQRIGLPGASHDTDSPGPSDKPEGQLRPTGVYRSVLALPIGAKPVFHHEHNTRALQVKQDCDIEEASGPPISRGQSF